MRIKNLILNRTARVGAFFAAIALMLGFAPTANAAAGNNNIKIIAWYGAGQLAGSEYARDIVQLFNPTSAPITLHNWSIQTASSLTATANVFGTVNYKLPTDITIPAGGYYMIAGSGHDVGTAGTECVGANCQNDYPYDYQLKTIEGPAENTTLEKTNSLSSTAVTVALVDNQVPMGSCDLNNPHLVDIIGIAAADGTTTVLCYAGGGHAPVKPTTLPNYHGVKYAYATVRRNRCTDTFDNTNDWTLGYVQFKNSSTTPEPCPLANQTNVDLAVATPNNPVKGTAFLVTAQPTAAAGTTLTSVIADLSNVGASATTTMYDDGTHGDAVANDGTYSVSATVAAATATGNIVGMSVTATDSSGNRAIAPLAFTVSASTAAYSNIPGPGNNNIRMLAWYGAGSLAGSEYSRDTVILFNPTARPITMNNWALLQGGATGKFTSLTYLLPNVTLPPGGYYAIAGSGHDVSVTACKGADCHLDYQFDYQLKSLEGIQGNTAYTPDKLLTLNSLPSTVVTVALVDTQSSTGIGDGCLKENAHVIDLVGLGSVTGSSPPTCYTGSSYAPFTPASYPGTDSKDPTTSIHGVKYAYGSIRTNKCVGTWDNARDWTLGYIDYKNSLDAPAPCASTAVGGSIASQLRITAAATPSTAHALDTVLFTAKVSPSIGATVSSVTAELSNLGLSETTVLYDDGTHGDVTAGDNTYSVNVIPVAAPYFGQQLALNVTATDSAGQSARANVPFNLDGGTFEITSAQGTTGTVKAGQVVYFDLTIKSIGGYFGNVVLECTGDPHPDGKLTPVKSQCVFTPPIVAVPLGGTGKTRFAVAAGTTVLSGMPSHNIPLMLMGLLSGMLLAVTIWRRKHLPLASVLALICFLSLQSTGCGTNAGLGGTDAEPGTYTFTLHGKDANSVTINTSTTITVTIQ